MKARWKRYVAQKFNPLFKKSEDTYRVAKINVGYDFYTLNYKKYKEIFDDIFGDSHNFGEVIEFEAYWEDPETFTYLLENIYSFSDFLKFLFQHYSVESLMKMRVDVTKMF